MKQFLLALTVTFAVAKSFAVGYINAGTSVPGTRFPIYAPEPSNPYVQIIGNSPIGQPSGTTVYGGGLLAGTRYVMEFWAGPESATSFSELTLIRSTTFRSAPATPESLPNGLVFTEMTMVPGVSAGERAKLAMRAWDTETGSSYDTAWIRGSGNLFLSGLLGGLPDGGGPPLINPDWVGESFSLVIVPEPATAALVGLGAVSLLIFRRRK